MVSTQIKVQHLQYLVRGAISIIMLTVASDRTDTDDSLVRHELCQKRYLEEYWTLAVGVHFSNLTLSVPKIGFL